jgi:hypothetical protein
MLFCNSLYMTLFDYLIVFSIILAFGIGQVINQSENQNSRHLRHLYRFLYNHRNEFMRGGNYDNFIKVKN